jgi:hypothetical protein
MNPIKFVVLGSSLVASAAVFMNWISFKGELPKLLADLPVTGMQNGGPIFLFFLGLAVIAGAIGAARRFGRGLAVLALVGALCSTLLGILKWGDISDATKSAEQLGGLVELSIAPGYWIFFLGSLVAFVASIAGLVKPEKAPAPAKLGTAATA